MTLSFSRGDELIMKHFINVWQVFGLTGRFVYLLITASRVLPSALWRFSFLFTAARQFRFYTGFPFHVLSKLIQNHVFTVTICRYVLYQIITDYSASVLLFFLYSSGILLRHEIIQLFISMHAIQ